MIVDRRTAMAVLAGSIAIGAAPTRTHVRAPVVVTDSRLAASRAFLAQVRPVRAIDIAEADAGLWREVRSMAPAGERVIGLTRWSDWVVLRGLFQDKGLRVRAEKKLAAAGLDKGAVFHWEMG